MNYHEEIYESGDMDVDLNNWETEKYLLESKIKDLQNAMDKSKKLHQKFVDDAIESEEIRNREFYRTKRELKAINKQQIAEIRELTKAKNFYELTCNELMKECEKSSTAEQSKQSSTNFEPFQSKSSTAESSKLPSTSRGERKTTRGASKYKISTKLFEDNKKLKDKISKITKANATLRQQVQRLEKFKLKMKSGKDQQLVDQQKIRDILEWTTATNSQIFNQLALSKLDESYGIRSEN